MILTYPNEDGYLKGYFCFTVINNKWQICNDGTILEIGGCWIHENHRDENLLIKMINQVFIHSTTQKIEYVVYQKEKTGEQLFVPASKYLQFINKGENNES